MREILFRGKRQRIEDWVEGSLIVYPDGDCYIARPSNNPCVLDKFNIDPATVGQFTGLTDTNGRNIFEHDIVEEKVRCRSDKNGNPVFRNRRYVVVWECNCFWLKPIKGHSRAIGRFGRCERIGNLHDNPELLEG